METFKNLGTVNIIDKDYLDKNIAFFKAIDSALENKEDIGLFYAEQPWYSLVFVDDETVMPLPVFLESLGLEKDYLEGEFDMWAEQKGIDIIRIPLDERITEEEIIEVENLEDIILTKDNHNNELVGKPLWGTTITEWAVRYGEKEFVWNRFMENINFPLDAWKRGELNSKYVPGLQDNHTFSDESGEGAEYNDFIPVVNNLTEEEKKNFRLEVVTNDCNSSKLTVYILKQ